MWPDVKVSSSGDRAAGIVAALSFGATTALIYVLFGFVRRLWMVSGGVSGAAEIAAPAATAALQTAALCYATTQFDRWGAWIGGRAVAVGAAAGGLNFLLSVVFAVLLVPAGDSVGLSVWILLLLVWLMFLPLASLVLAAALLQRLPAR